MLTQTLVFFSYTPAMDGSLSFFCHNGIDFCVEQWALRSWKCQEKAKPILLRAWSHLAPKTVGFVWILVD